jgi:peptidoglycan/xylan/chitin deacetylase (PgdA/CDA1 family)/TolA-binding protein
VLALTLTTRAGSLAANVMQTHTRPGPAMVVAVLCLALAGAGCRAVTADTPVATPPAVASLQASLIVTAHRQVIALLDEGNGLGTEDRQRAEVLARVIFHENRQRLDQLAERLLSDRAALPAVLDFIENGPDLRDADKLAFRDLLTDLASDLGDAKPALRARLQADVAVLGQIQARYDKELEKIFGRLGTRGLTDRRESWESYVAFVRTQVDVPALLRERGEGVGVGDEDTRGSGGESAFETFGRRLPPKTVVLTFDDGPHARHTDRIREILAKAGAKAVFFHVGQNLGAVGKDSQVHATRAAAASQRLLEAGHTLANHSFTHSFLPKLDEVRLNAEIEMTERMLTEVSKSRSDLFRAPYGARNALVRDAIAAHKLRSVMWNVDSQDWADPVPASIADRVVRIVEAEKRGIILFHDIQQRTVEALPLVLEALQARGYRFLSWNGQEFVDDATRSGATAPAEEPAPSASFYRESWAVVVGIDQYQSWPRLHYAVNDAKGVRDLLVRRYHFKPENVVTLLDGEATRAAILKALGDRLADPARVHRDDRVFVFFAGHGVTRKLPSGKSLGYLVPVDADRDNYQSQAISMTNFQDVSEAIPAKHVLFVTDACYSGVALTRGGASGTAGLAYLREVTRRSVRQMLTAGGADEEVADGGPQGHSIFTWALMQGLDGQADLSGDGFITASELAAYVGPTVSALSRQTPAFGNLVGSEGGEFLFELKHESEFLNELTDQLDEEAIRLNAELARVREQIAEKRSRNEKLREELAAEQARLTGAGKTASGTVAARGAPTAAERNDTGMVHFREKRYVEALAEFEAAARMRPTVALFANNAGFACYKLGRNDEAAAWFEKTLALDPRRAIAHANLGDALLAAGRRDQARAAFEKYLEAAPTASYATSVRRKLEELSAARP